MIDFSKREQVAPKGQIKTNKMIFFRIKVYAEIHGYELLVIFSTKWEDYSERQKCDKFSKIPNERFIVQFLG